MMRERPFQQQRQLIDHNTSTYTCSWTIPTHGIPSIHTTTSVVSFSVHYIHSVMYIERVQVINWSFHWNELALTGKHRYYSTPHNWMTPCQ